MKKSFVFLVLGIFVLMSFSFVSAYANEGEYCNEIEGIDCLVNLSCENKICVSATPKEGTQIGGPVCNNLVENAGSVRLVDFSADSNPFDSELEEFANVTFEVTINDYIGSSFLGFFHPMKLSAYDVTHGELTEEDSVAGEGSLVSVAPSVLGFAKYSSLRHYPIKENISFQVYKRQYPENKIKMHFILTTKTLWDSRVEFTQGDLGVLEVCLNQPEGICPNEVPAKKFKSSEVLYDISEDTGRPDQYYCSYDETRNKIAIIIKENGFYDDSRVIDLFNQYFVSVRGHLNISSVGVKKFNGSTTSQFDTFIESLVENESVGYIIFVGADLPIVKIIQNEFNQNQSMLDFGTINDIYSYVNRTKEVGVNECIDVAISTVIAPQTYSIENKRNFIISVFLNFINYHNPTQTFNNFNKNILMIEHNTSIDSPPGSGIGEYAPENFSPYREIYFYPVNYFLNTNSDAINLAMKNNSLILMYSVHGSSDLLGLGLNKTYVSNQQIIDFCNSYGQISLFVNAVMACGQNLLSPGPNDETFCCWPQTWLKTGVWTVFIVDGDPYHNNFERWFFKEKIIGKALRKTYHDQDMIYGDILGTAPNSTNTI